MRINRDNYELYFLDHAEGTLSREMERELAIFLASNPDLASVLKRFDATPLPPSDVQNQDLKQRLKKNIRPTFHINEANVEEWMIREIEDLLSAPEKAELEEFLRLNPAYGYDRKLFGMTRMEPDPVIVFSRKKELKKKAPVILLVRSAWLASAAAAVILLVFGIRYFNRQPVNDSQQVIQTDAQPVAKLPSKTTEKPLVKTAEMKKTEPATAQKGMESASWRMESPFRIDQRFEVSSIQVSPPEPLAMDLAMYEPVRIDPEPEKNEKKVLAKAFGKMVIKARNAVGSNPDLDNIRSADVDFWTLAKAGVKGFSTVTDRDLELMVRRDGDGNIKSYALVEEDRLILTKSRD